MSQRFSANRFTAVIDEDLDGSELTVSLDVNGSNPMTIAINDGTNEVDASFVVRGESLRALLSWLMIESRKQRGGRGLLELDAPAESVDISPTERPEQRWHEIAREGLPATWTFVSTWDAECPNGGVGYLQLYPPADAEDEDATPVWHDDHGHRAERGVTHWHPLPAPPMMER